MRIASSSDRSRTDKTSVLKLLIDVPFAAVKDVGSKAGVDEAPSTTMQRSKQATKIAHSSSLSVLSVNRAGHFRFEWQQDETDEKAAAELAAHQRAIYRFTFNTFAIIH